MENLKKFATNKVVKEIENDPFFKHKCVQKFFFLIDNYGFNKIETEDFGKGAIVIFKKKEKEDLSINIEYEMGTLPTVEIFSNLDTSKFFSEENSLKSYSVHYEIRQKVQGKVSSIDNYIKELGAIWERKYDEISIEIDSCLESLAHKVEKYLSKENFYL